MSGIVADSAGLVQERWAHDFSIGSGLVFDKVAGIFLFGFARITAYDAKGLGLRGSITAGGISGGRQRRRH